MYFSGVDTEQRIDNIAGIVHFKLAPLVTKMERLVNEEEEQLKVRPLFQVREKK